MVYRFTKLQSFLFEVYTVRLFMSANKEYKRTKNINFYRVSSWPMDSPPRLKHEERK